jgi:hypothetical protein
MLNLQSVYFGQKHHDFDYRDFDIIKKVSRLVNKHHKQCENDCNGEGYINNKWYRCDNPSAYVNDETVFYIEIKRIEDKINKLIYQFNMDKYSLWRVKPLKVEYQHDPRGNTVKVYFEDDFIEL